MGRCRRTTNRGMERLSLDNYGQGFSEMKIEWIKSVRSIATVILILTYAYLAAKGVIDAKDFQSVILVVLTFYFVKNRKNGGRTQ